MRKFKIINKNAPHYGQTCELASFNESADHPTTVSLRVSCTATLDYYLYEVESVSEIEEATHPAKFQMTRKDLKDLIKEAIYEYEEDRLDLHEPSGNIFQLDLAADCDI